MADLAKIKRNVAKMAGMNAPESDIDGYISSEGVTIDQVREYNPETIAQKPQEQISGIESAARGGFYGALQQPRDVVSAGLMKGAGYLGLADTKDIPFKDLLSSANELSLEGRSQQAKEEDPYAFGGGQLAGNIAASLIPAGMVSKGLAAAAPVVSKAPLIGKALSGGMKAVGTGKAGVDAGLKARAATLAGQGAIQGGAYSAVTKGDLSDAPTGALVGGALPIVGAGGKALGKKLVEKTIIPNADEIGKIATGLYKKAEDLGASFKPETRGDVLKKSKELIVDDAATLEQLGGDEVTEAILKFAEGGEKLTLNTFQNLDGAYGSKAHKAFVAGDRDLARKYGELQHNIRNAVADEKNIIGSSEGLEAQKEATRLWSIKMKMGDIERIVEDSQLAAVPASAIRTGFRRITTNPKLLRGYTKEEQKAIRKAAETGALDSIMHTFGSRLMGIIGAGVGGVKGAVVGHGVSSAGRAGAEALRKADAAKVTRLLAERSGIKDTVNRFTNKKLLAEALKNK